MAEVSPTPSSISTTPQGPLVTTVSTGHRFQVLGCTIRAVPCMRAGSKPGARARWELSPAKAAEGPGAHPLSPGASSSILHGRQAWCPPLSHRPGSCSPNRLWDFLRHHLEHTVENPLAARQTQHPEDEAAPGSASHSSNPPCGLAATDTFLRPCPLLPCSLSPHWGNRELPEREP